MDLHSFLLSVFKFLYKYILYAEHILLDTLSCSFLISTYTFSHSRDLYPPSLHCLWWVGQLRVRFGVVSHWQQHWGEQALNNRVDRLGRVTGEPVQRSQSMRTKGMTPPLTNCSNWESGHCTWPGQVELALVAKVKVGWTRGLENRRAGPAACCLLHWVS